MEIKRVKVMLSNNAVYYHRATTWKVTSDGILTILNADGGYTMYAPHGWVYVEDVKEDS